MTLFFIILLVVFLGIYGFQKFKKKPEVTIKPSLPKVEENAAKPATPPEPPRPIPAMPKKTEPVKEQMPEPVSPPAEAEQAPEPVLLPAEKEEPMLSSPEEEEPKPPGNLPVE